MSSPQRQRYNLALAFWNVGAVLTRDSDHPLVVERDGPNGKERGFKLELHDKNPRAPLSPLYLNLRTKDHPKQGPLTLDIVEMAALQMHAVLEGVSFGAVAGVPRAGTAFGQSIAKLRCVPHIPLVKGAHRSDLSFGGYIPMPFTRVLVADDVISRAGSKYRPIELLRHSDLDVRDVGVLVDRMQGGREQLAHIGCRMHAVFMVTQLLDIYVEARKMPAELQTDILQYFAISA